MRVLVVTGGIGSGKSLSCKILHDEYGWPVYDADSKVKELYLSHPSLLSEIENAMGKSLRDPDGNFLPYLLAEIIFSDKQMLETVESLVFPVLMQDFEKWKLDNERHEVVILESATVLEKPSLKGLGDFTILIDAPLSVRMERAVSRDASSQEKVLARMNLQTLMNEISSGLVVPQVDALVSNDGDIDLLRTKLQEFVGKVI